jgi:hypothetical protein
MTDVWRRRFDTLRDLLLCKIELASPFTDHLPKSTILPPGY